MIFPLSLFTRALYRGIAKPIFFRFDPEKVHNQVSKVGEWLGSDKRRRALTRKLWNYDSPKLSQTLSGITFNNPVGFAAGFDYDGHVAAILPAVGFGFNTVGTVTYHAYEGNPGLRLGRLPRSQSLLVNKGFKSEGAGKIRLRLRLSDFENAIIGISIGSSNVLKIDTLSKAINDYCAGFEVFRNESYLTYFELNISCPNTKLGDGFSLPKNFLPLIKSVQNLQLQKPIFVKMPNEKPLDIQEALVKIGIEHGISGFIFSNLVKDRNNPVLNRGEVSKVKGYQGNFSGKPTFENSNRTIAHIYNKFGRNTIIVGCGGIFNARDAYTKIKLGASLVQLITGMIFEGPQLAGQINYGLAQLLKRDGYQNISEAIGQGSG